MAGGLTGEECDDVDPTRSHNAKLRHRQNRHEMGTQRYETENIFNQICTYDGSATRNRKK